MTRSLVLRVYLDGQWRRIKQGDVLVFDFTNKTVRIERGFA